MVGVVTTRRDEKMMIDDDENENEIVCSSFFLVFVRALSFRVCVRPLPSPSCGRVKTKKKKLSPLLIKTHTTNNMLFWILTHYDEEEY